MSNPALDFIGVLNGIVLIFAGLIKVLDEPKNSHSNSF